MFAVDPKDFAIIHLCIQYSIQYFCTLVNQSMYWFVTFLLKLTYVYWSEAAASIVATKQNAKTIFYYKILRRFTTAPIYVFYI